MWKHPTKQYKQLEVICSKCFFKLDELNLLMPPKIDQQKIEVDVLPGVGNRVNFYENFCTVDRNTSVEELFQQFNWKIASPIHANVFY